MQTRQPGNATAVQTFSFAGKASRKEIFLCLPADNINDNDWTWKELVYKILHYRTLKGAFAWSDLFENPEREEM